MIRALSHGTRRMVPGADRAKVSGDEAARKKSQEQAKIWLDNCLRLFRVQQYEDDRLRDHALELIQQLNQALGVEDQMDDDDNAWEDEDDDDERRRRRPGGRGR